MKPYLLLFLIFSGLKLRSQDLSLAGQIVDKDTKKPIPGATVGVRIKNFFLAAGGDGRFELSYLRLAITDTLTISCLGYQTRHILIGKIKQPLVVTMEQYLTQLSEVKIGLPTVEVGSKADAHALTASFFPDMEAAMFMVGSPQKKGTIQAVGFYMSEGQASARGDATAPFRIKIFGVSADGSPGEELTDDLIIASAKANNEWFDIDLSPYHIKAPRDGFFVCFALLNKDYYLLGKDYKKDPLITKSIDVITPRLGLTTDEFKEQLCFFRINKGNNYGSWVKHLFNSNYMIRATIKLSK